MFPNLHSNLIDRIIGNIELRSTVVVESNVAAPETSKVLRVVLPETSRDVRVPTEVREDETIFAPRDVDPITVVPAIL